MKLRVAIGLFLVHLVLVVLGAAQIPLESWGKWGRLLRIYGSLSGSTSNYSFFAPSVGSPLHASFNILEKTGKTTTEELSASDRELSLRLGDIIDVFQDRLQDQRVRRSLAASWAGYVLAKHPSAQGIQFKLEQYEVPTMEAFRSGKQARWDSIYSATFRRRTR